MSKHLCPVCGKYEFDEYGSYDVCDVCGWEDDPVQMDDPEYEGGANELSLKQARIQYRKMEGSL